jgi:hypothetical protein
MRTVEPGEVTVEAGPRPGGAMTDPAPPAAVPAQAAVPARLVVADALGGAATRVGLLAVPWLFALTGSGLPFVVAGTVALAGPYVLTCVLTPPPAGRPARPGARSRTGRGPSIVADLLGMLVLVAVPVIPREGWSWPVLGLLGAVGLLRGVADQARRGMLAAGAPAPAGGPLSWLSAGLAGAGAGLLAGWLGLAGAVWLVAMAMAGSAALVAVAPPPALTGRVAEPDHAVPEEAAAPPAGSPVTTGPGSPVRRWAVSLGRGFADLARDRLALALTGTLLVAGALLQAAGVLLVPAWVRDALHAPATLGVIGGSVLVGALLGRAGRSPSAGERAGWAALAAGYLLVGVPAAVGFGHGPHRLPDILLAGALAAGSGAFGLALGATAPGPVALADPLLPPGRRARVSGLAGGLGMLAVPAGGLAGGWLAGRVGFTGAVAWGGGLAALAVLAPLAGYRAWQHAERLERAAPGTAEVVAVTIGYADGEWTVEIGSGRRRLAGRQAIKPAEALDVVDLLEVPGLHEEVERTVAADQAYARQHAEELRGQLDELETRMAGMSTLIELSELRRASPGG